MNEDENGITPANVTAMTMDRVGRDWQVVIEQGNGNVIKMFELTEMERVQLAFMLGSEPGTYHVSFMDVTR